MSLPRPAVMRAAISVPVVLHESLRRVPDAGEGGGGDDARHGHSFALTDPEPPDGRVLLPGVRVVMDPDDAGDGSGLDSLAAIPFFLGVWAPAASAAIVVRTTGGWVKVWLRDIMRWRVPARYYLFALGFPVALAALASAEFALAGESLDFGLVGERAVAILPLLLFCFLVNGGPEEPAWRGFALPSSKSATRRCERRRCSAWCGASGTCRCCWSRTTSTTT